MRFSTSWLARLLRGRRLDRNLLRRHRARRAARRVPRRRAVRRACRRDQLTGRAQLAAGGAVGGLAAVLITAGWLVRRSLDRRRLSGWDAEWLANGPR